MGCQKGAGGRCCRAVGFFVLILFGAFFVAISSLIISCNIVARLSTNNADGSQTHPSAPAALAVLFTVCS